MRTILTLAVCLLFVCLTTADYGRTRIRKPSIPQSPINGLINSHSNLKLEHPVHTVDKVSKSGVAKVGHHPIAANIGTDAANKVIGDAADIVDHISGGGVSAGHPEAVAATHGLAQESVHVAKKTLHIATQSGQVHKKPHIGASSNVIRDVHKGPVVSQPKPVITGPAVLNNVPVGTGLDVMPPEIAKILGSTINGDVIEGGHGGFPIHGGAGATNDNGLLNGWGADPTAPNAPFSGAGIPAVPQMSLQAEHNIVKEANHAARKAIGGIGPVVAPVVGSIIPPRPHRDMNSIRAQVDHLERIRQQHKMMGLIDSNEPLNQHADMKAHSANIQHVIVKSSNGGMGQIGGPLNPVHVKQEHPSHTVQKVRDSGVAAVGHDPLVAAMGGNAAGDIIGQAAHVVDTLSEGGVSDGHPVAIAAANGIANEAVHVAGKTLHIASQNSQVQTNGHIGVDSDFHVDRKIRHNTAKSSRGVTIDRTINGKYVRLSDFNKNTNWNHDAGKIEHHIVKSSMGVVEQIGGPLNPVNVKQEHPTHTVQKVRDSGVAAVGHDPLAAAMGGNVAGDIIGQAAHVVDTLSEGGVSDGHPVAIAAANGIANEAVHVAGKTLHIASQNSQVQANGPIGIDNDIHVASKVSHNIAISSDGVMVGRPMSDRYVRLSDFNKNTNWNHDAGKMEHQIVKSSMGAAGHIGGPLNPVHIIQEHPSHTVQKVRDSGVAAVGHDPLAAAMGGGVAGDIIGQAAHVVDTLSEGGVSDGHPVAIAAANGIANEAVHVAGKTLHIASQNSQVQENGPIGINNNIQGDRKLRHNIAKSSGGVLIDGPLIGKYVRLSDFNKNTNWNHDAGKMGHHNVKSSMGGIGQIVGPLNPVHVKQEHPSHTVQKVRDSGVAAVGHDPLAAAMGGGVAGDIIGQAAHVVDTLSEGGVSEGHPVAIAAANGIANEAVHVAGKTLHIASQNSQVQANGHIGVDSDIHVDRKIRHNIAKSSDGVTIDRTINGKYVRLSDFNRNGNWNHDAGKMEHHIVKSSMGDIGQIGGPLNPVHVKQEHPSHTVQKVRDSGVAAVGHDPLAAAMGGNVAGDIIGQAAHVVDTLSEGGVSEGHPVAIAAANGIANEAVHVAGKTLHIASKNSQVQENGPIAIDNGIHVASKVVNTITKSSDGVMVGRPMSDRYVRLSDLNRNGNWNHDADKMEHQIVKSSMGGIGQIGGPLNPVHVKQEHPTHTVQKVRDSGVAAVGHDPLAAAMGGNVAGEIIGQAAHVVDTLSEGGVSDGHPVAIAAANGIANEAVHVAGKTLHIASQNSQVQDNGPIGVDNDIHVASKISHTIAKSSGGVMVGRPMSDRYVRLSDFNKNTNWNHNAGKMEHELVKSSMGGIGQISGPLNPVHVKQEHPSHTVKKVRDSGVAAVGHDPLAAAMGGGVAGDIIGQAAHVVDTLSDGGVSEGHPVAIAAANGIANEAVHVAGKTLHIASQNSQVQDNGPMGIDNDIHVASKVNHNIVKSTGGVMVGRPMSGQHVGLSHLEGGKFHLNLQIANPQHKIVRSGMGGLGQVNTGITLEHPVHTVDKVSKSGVAKVGHHPIAANIGSDAANKVIGEAADIVDRISGGGVSNGHPVAVGAVHGLAQEAVHVAGKTLHIASQTGQVHPKQHIGVIGSEDMNSVHPKIPTGYGRLRN